MKITKIINYFNFFLHSVSFDKHKRIRNKIIKMNNRSNELFYNYGEGFFYQSIPVINLRGLRNTKKRIEILELFKILNKKIILDIGTNVGAIPLSTHSFFKSCVGIDHNPDVINISQEIQRYLKIKNVNFICDSFLKYSFDIKFDVVLSLANHSTFDKGIDNTSLYFEKIKKILKKNGILILESHSPLYEKRENYLSLVKDLKKDYQLLNSGEYFFGNHYDKGRLFNIMKKID